MSPLKTERAAIVKNTHRDDAELRKLTVLLADMNDRYRRIWNNRDRRLKRLQQIEVKLHKDSNSGPIRDI